MTTDDDFTLTAELDSPAPTPPTFGGSMSTTTGKFADNEITLVDHYTLSADGRTLTVRRHFEGKQRGGVQDQVLVHRKQ